MKQFKICEKRKGILDTDRHILIEGGPGSGKTTIALLKAKNIIDLNLLKPNQKVLFLSFARATIARIEEQAKGLFNKEHKKSIEINTYHGFSWSIIQAFGYLLTSHRVFKLITPPNLSAQLAEIPEKERYEFQKQLFHNYGTVSFDLFAEVASSILERSKKISSIISSAYPYLIVDEFQDTDIYEWNLIKQLGKQSKVIALADLNQRIYEFRGASLTRIPEFSKHFQVSRFDLGLENNRSTGTDIVQFGDDLLQGINIGKTYNNVQIIRYPYYAEIKTNLKYALLKSINRVKTNSPNDKWSIAILVKSKNETLSVSSYLLSQNITHEVIIDPAGPSLAASIISKNLEPTINLEEQEKQMVKYLINHIKGRKSDRIPKKDLELTKSLETYLQTGKIKGKNRTSLIEEIKVLLKKRSELVLSGNPFDDWLAVRRLFQDSKHEALKNVYEDSRFLRLLNKGAVLNEMLSEIWRRNGAYLLASLAVENALTQEHFSMANRSWTGIFVMNMHKSKGKEFDEVLIWEEPFKQIVPPDASLSRIQQDRLILRVAVTRAKCNSIILTPKSSPCILL